MLKFFACATLLCVFSLGEESSDEDSYENSNENSVESPALLTAVWDVDNPYSNEPIDVEEGSSLNFVVLNDDFVTFSEDEDFGVLFNMAENVTMWICYQSNSPGRDSQSHVCQIPCTNIENCNEDSSYYITAEDAGVIKCTGPAQGDSFDDFKVQLDFTSEDFFDQASRPDNLQVILCAYDVSESPAEIYPLGKSEFELFYKTASPSYSASPTPGDDHSLLPFEFEFPDDVNFDLKSFLVNVCAAVQDTFTDNGDKDNQAVTLYCILEKDTFNPTTNEPTNEPTTQPTTEPTVL